MASSIKTIKKAKLARVLYSKGNGTNKDKIAKALNVSKARVDEYLEKNNHKASCPVCSGFGVNKQRSTGIRKAICTR